jgi:hypothetical protein
MTFIRAKNKVGARSAQGFAKNLHGRQPHRPCGSSLVHG